MGIDALLDTAGSKSGRVIAVINQKGGVGKTTFVINVGAGLANMGCKVLIVDLDPQAHLTYSMGINADDLEVTVYELMKGEATFDEVLLERHGVGIIPASINLSAAEMKFSSETRREALLKKILPKVSGYDYVVMDCPPNLGLLTLNALATAREVFVPLQAEYLSIKSFNKITEMVERVRQRINPQLSITGIVATFIDHRLRLHQEVVESLRKVFGNKLFSTVIRRNVDLAEATSFGEPIFEYAPSSRGAKDYRALCKEILGRG